MTRQEIVAVLDRVRTWPEDRQEDAARILLRMEEIGLEPHELTDEERADLEAALREEERGEFATVEEVEAVFARYRSA